MTPAPISIRNEDGSVSRQMTITSNEADVGARVFSGELSEDMRWQELCAMYKAQYLALHKQCRATSDRLVKAVGDISARDVIIRHAIAREPRKHGIASPANAVFGLLKRSAEMLGIIKKAEPE